MTITRLGEGVDATHRLRPEAMERTFAASARLPLHHGRRGRRPGAPGGHLGSARRRQRRGLPPSRRRTSSACRRNCSPGSEEGRLSYAGATGDLPAGPGDGRRPRHRWRLHGDRDEVGRRRSCSVSLDIGCVRLTERFLPRRPAHGRRAMAAAVAPSQRSSTEPMEAIPPLADLGREPRLVGLAGTVSTLASLELGLVDYDREQIHHAVLTAEAVERWCEVLGGERVEERARRPAFRRTPGRDLRRRVGAARGDAPVSAAGMHRFGGRHPRRPGHVAAAAVRGPGGGSKGGSIVRESDR